VTGHAMEEVVKQVAGPRGVYRGLASATGSAGTIASGDYMKQAFPGSVIVASEALQCPTLLENGFGSHRIEGIGDKHIPWIHNTKNTDMVVAIDDNAVVNISRLFNEPAGRKYLALKGVPESIINNLDLLGFSGISNVLSAIKAAKYYEMGEDDIMVTVLTDSMELYQSRLQEMHGEFGDYSEKDAAADFARYLLGQSTDNLLELRFEDRRRVHNLKYFTWVEQQGKTYAEIQSMWNERDYFTGVQKQAAEIDELIEEFNKEVGLN
jgi:cysteine synthase A